MDEMVSTYEQIGMDDEYVRCIQDFASLEVSGQIAAGGTGSPLSTLLGGSGSGSMGSDMLGQLLGSFLSGGYSDIAGLTGSNSGFFSDRMVESSTEYVAKNQFDGSQLQWREGKDGVQILSLEDEQWDLIQNLELNLFYDDGEGYIDLGLDNIYAFDEEGNLILVFDEENPRGYIAGAQTDYEEDVTRTVAKGLLELEPGDRLDFLCDYYSYDGEFQDNYYLGEPMT